MLPPVSAVTAGELSPQTPGQKPDAVASPANQPTTPQAISDTSPNIPVVAARAISGEAELHRTGTVLAEVLGSLLGMERLEGEDAGAYVNRLTSALQSLPIAQRATLEQQLGTLLKGMTIALMLDILKNNAGPNAARLAAMLELARVGQSEDGVKVALPPYLQDLLPDSPSLNLRPVNGPPPATLLSRLPLPVGENDSLTRKPATISPAPPAEQADAQPASNTASPATQAFAKATTQTPLPSQITAQNADAPLSTPQALPPEQCAQSSPQPAPSSKAGLLTLPPQSADVPMITQDGAADHAPLTPFLKTDAATIARQFRGASPQDMETLLLAVLLGRLPERADPLPSTFSAPPIVPHEETSDAEAPKTQQFLTSGQTQGHSTGAANEESPAAMLRPEAPAAASALATADGKSLAFEQAALQSAVASLITKPGTPLPFVNYPIEEQKRDEDAPPRGRWPSSDGEGEGGAEEEAGQNHPDQNDAQQNHPDEPLEEEERVAANDEPVDHSVSEGAREDGRVGDAESYYLRMGNFT